MVISGLLLSGWYLIGDFMFTMALLPFISRVTNGGPKIAVNGDDERILLYNTEFDCSDTIVTDEDIQDSFVVNS